MVRSIFDKSAAGSAAGATARHAAATNWRAVMGGSPGVPECDCNTGLAPGRAGSVSDRRTVVGTRTPVADARGSPRRFRRMRSGLPTELRAADDDAGEEHKYTAEDHLGERGPPRRIHVAVADP